MITNETHDTIVIGILEWGGIASGTWLCREGAKDGKRAMKGGMLFVQGDENRAVASGGGYTLWSVYAGVG